MRRLGRREGGWAARGVTLVELVCVTAIVLVLAGVALPVASTAVKRHRELELRRALREIRPDVRVLLCSGYPRGGKVEALVSEGAAGFLRKPFHVRQVIELIEDAMAGNFDLAASAQRITKLTGPKRSAPYKARASVPTCSISGVRIRGSISGWAQTNMRFSVRSGVAASTNDSSPSRWSSSSASIAVASSSSVAALNERSSNPSACIRFFV